MPARMSAISRLADRFGRLRRDIPSAAGPHQTGPAAAMVRNRLRDWWFPLEPYARVAILRSVIYLFVVVDIRWFVNDVVPKGYVPADLYQPILVPRVLHLPAPNPLIVHTLEAVLVVGCLIAAAGFLPRLAGWAVALAFTWWLFIDMSYGKVDHDHLALLVALYVLPTVGARTPNTLWPLRLTTRGWRDVTRTEAAGWALRCIQVAVVATYFLSAWAKIRIGGWHWPTGATFAWAIDRRGTWLADPAVNYPWVLVAGQWTLILAEALSPLVFVLRGRWRAAFIGFWLFFHLTTYLAITIHFLPTAVGWLAFAPLERTRSALRATATRLRRKRRRTDLVPEVTGG
jgi:hypothetical protein